MSTSPTLSPIPSRNRRRNRFRNLAPNAAAGIQDCLNRIFALSLLPVNGILDAASRSAIRRLQKPESLPITGIVVRGTEQASALVR